MADHFGEFEDGKVYTHKRAAALMGVDTEWVKDRLLFPRDRNGNRVPGVRHAKVGAFYMFSGESVRHWIDGNNRPDEAE